MNRIIIITAILITFGYGGIPKDSGERMVLAKISPELYEKSVQAPSAKIPVWVEFVDRPFKNNPLQYLEYVKTHSYLPPVNETYVQNILSLPNVEFLGTSELTNELGILMPSYLITDIANLQFVNFIEEMPILVPEGEYIPPYSTYQGVYYNATDLRNLQDSFSGYKANYQNGDTLGKHMKLTILDTGTYPYHPAFWNTNIRLTPNDNVHRTFHSIAARDNFVHLAYLRRIPAGWSLCYKRSQDFGINWSNSRVLASGQLWSVDIATAGNNVYIITVENTESGTSILRFGRCINNGAGLTSLHSIHTYNSPPDTGFGTAPRIAAQGTGVYVTWSEETLQDSIYINTSVRFLRNLTSGTGNWALEAIHYIIGYPDITLSVPPDIAAGVGGTDVHISWLQYYQHYYPPPNEPASRLFYCNSTDQGVNWNPPQILYTAPQLRGIWSLSISASGNKGHIVFTKSYVIDTLSISNIYYINSPDLIPTQLSFSGTAGYPATAAADSFVYAVWEERIRDTLQVLFKRNKSLGAGTWDDGDDFAGNNNADITKQISFTPTLAPHLFPNVTATAHIPSHIRMVHISWLDYRNSPILPEIYYSSSSKICAWRDYRTHGNQIPTDYDDHGTNVSSIASGCLVARTSSNANFNPYLGVAWQGILAVGAVHGYVGTPYDDSVFEATVIQGIKWAVDTINTDVINISLGSETGDREAKHRLTQYVDWATGRGKVVCVGAGNQGPWPGPDSLSWPGDNFNAITVGATTYNGTEVWNNSSRGPTADGRIKPDVVAPGDGIYLADTNRINSLYRLGSGTSFATSMVAGVCALLLQANPARTPGAIRKALRKTATDLNGNPLPNPNDSIGWGRIKAWAARNYNVNNFPPEIIPTAIPYPTDSLSGQQGDSVTLWIWVKDRECANNPRANVNLTSIGGPADTIMAGNWVANQWVRCSVRVRINPTTPTGRKFLKVTASEGPNGDRDTVWAYININITPAPGIEEGISQIKYPILLMPKPNPFRNHTAIRFQIPTKTKVELKIYSSIGQVINTLIADEMKPGYYTVTWDGKDEYKRTQSKGIYFARLKTKDYDATRKIIHIR